MNDAAKFIAGLKDATMGEELPAVFANTINITDANKTARIVFAETVRNGEPRPRVAVMVDIEMLAILRGMIDKVLAKRQQDGK